MRGKGRLAAEAVFVCGITPAYAGKRNRVAHKKRRHEDHPRLCGEKTSHARYNLFTMGSPPPMRGKVFLYHNNLTPNRITPAYAGKSLLDTGRKACSQDHPRLCGEKFTS